MSSLSLGPRYQAHDPSRRLKGLLVVIALHATLGYALASGMARKGLDLIRKPLQAAIIQEVLLPPPPSPPVKTPESLAPRSENAAPIAVPQSQVVRQVARTGLVRGINAGQKWR